MKEEEDILNLISEYLIMYVATIWFYSYFSTRCYSHFQMNQVSLSLEPRFKRSITYLFKSDVDLEEEFMDHAKKHEFADITWYPSQSQTVYRNDDRVPLNSSGDGTNDFVGFQSTSILVSSTVRSAGASFFTLYKFWFDDPYTLTQLLHM